MCYLLRAIQRVQKGELIFRVEAQYDRPHWANGDKRLAIAAGIRSLCVRATKDWKSATQTQDRKKKQRIVRDAEIFLDTRNRDSEGERQTPTCDDDRFSGLVHDARRTTHGTSDTRHTTHDSHRGKESKWAMDRALAAVESRGGGKKEKCNIIM